MITIKLLGANPDGTDKTRQLNTRHLPDMVADWVYGQPKVKSAAANFTTHMYALSHLDPEDDGIWCYLPTGEVY